MITQTINVDRYGGFQALDLHFSEGYVEPLNVFSTVAWLTYEYYTAQGDNDIVLFFSVASNSTGRPQRTGTIAVHNSDASGGDEIAEITVIQAQGREEDTQDTTATLTITPTSLSISSSLSQSVVTLKPNENVGNITVASSDSTWIKPTLDLATKTMTVAIGENTTTASRSGTVTITYYSKYNVSTPAGIITLPITQQGAVGTVTISTQNETDNLSYFAQEVPFDLYTKGVDFQSLSLKVYADGVLKYTLENDATGSGDPEWQPYLVAASIGGDSLANLWVRGNGYLRVPRSANNDGTPREIRAVLSAPSYSDASIIVTDDLVLTQLSKVLVVAKPIWRDEEIDLTPYAGDAPSVQYQVEDNDGNILYKGRVYPILNKYAFNVNEIVKLTEEFDWADRNNGIFDYGGTNTFVVRVNDAIIGRYFFFNDYTYKPESQYITDGFGGLSYPVKNEVDRRQYFVASTLTTPEGEENIGSVSISSRQGQSGIYSNGIYLNPSIGISTVKWRVSQFSGNILGYLDADSRLNEFNISECTHKYCLYYRNVYGGYDWVLLNGKESYDADRQCFVRRVLNYLPRHKSVNYNTNVTKSYNLTTDILNDRQSELMAKALLSPEAYLHILDTDEIIPVNIDESSIAVKSRNDSPKRYSFTVREDKKAIK